MKGVPRPVRKEPWKALNAFEVYLMMGPGRSIHQLSSAVGVKTNTLKSWATEFNWATRLDGRDRQAIEQLQQDSEVLYLETVKKRHINAYQKVQEKALKKLERSHVDFEDDKDAAVALDIGIKGERDVMGLRDSKLKMGVVQEGFAGMIEAVMKK